MSLENGFSLGTFEGDSDGKETMDTEKQTVSRNNYHRLVEYISYLAPYFLHIFIETVILTNRPFHEFLTIHKHVLFHLLEPKQCCECGTKYSPGPGVRLTRNQFDILYKTNKSKPRNPKCKRFNKYMCPCVITVDSKVKIESIDYKLASLIFEHALPTNAKQWIANIIKIRNRIFHLSECSSVDDKVFQQQFRSLSRSLGNIASAIGPEYKVKLQNEEKRILHQEISNVITSEKLLLTNIYKDRYETLQLRMNTLAKGSHKRHSQLHEKIDALSFCLNQLAVSVFGNESLTKLFAEKELSDCADKKTISVLFHMGVPDNVDKEKVAKSMEELAKTFEKEENGVINIRDSYTGELKIILEILKRVASNPAELQQELKTIVFNILESPNIDTSRAKFIDVNLTNMGEICVETVSFDKKWKGMAMKYLDSVQVLSQRFPTLTIKVNDDEDGLEFQGPKVDVQSATKVLSTMLSSVCVKIIPYHSLVLKLLQCQEASSFFNDILKSRQLHVSWMIDREYLIVVSKERLTIRKIQKLLKDNFVVAKFSTKSFRHSLFIKSPVYTQTVEKNKNSLLVIEKDSTGHRIASTKAIMSFLDSNTIRLSKLYKVI